MASMVAWDLDRGMADYSALSRECGLSRPTVKAHLEALTVSLARNPGKNVPGYCHTRFVLSTTCWCLAIQPDNELDVLSYHSRLRMNRS